MSDCPDVTTRELLPDYLHGSLDGPDRQLVEHHVAGCAECADELQLLRAVRESAAAHTPALDLAAIVAALPAPPHPLPVVRPVAQRRRAVPAWMGLAAALAIAALGSWAIGIGRSPSLVGTDSVAVQPFDTGAVVAGVAADEMGLSFGGGVTDLSDDDVIALLDEVEELDPAPPAEPDPAWGTLRGVGGP